MNQENSKSGIMTILLGKDAKERISYLSLFTLILILLLTWKVISFFELEKSFGLPRVFPIVIGAFILHSSIPLRFRLPVYLLLFFTLSWIAFHTFSSLLFIGGAIVIFGIVHLPVRFWLRIFMLMPVIAGFILLRSELVYAPRAQLVLPFLASLFMFRLIVYWYEWENGYRQGNWMLRISYFLMFPNICFPLFPVVDYRSFVNGYYEKPALEIYLEGIKKLIKGVLFLLLFRVIYQYGVISPSAIDDFFSLTRFSVFNYLMIFRLLGIYNVSIGLLGLFGFYLPPLFRNVFLADSFRDVWKRINIYWRDFIQKIVYYPVFFKLKKFGTQRALFVSIGIAFAATWFFHAYQWYWVAGFFPISTVDVSYWLIFGSVITLNVYFYEAKPKKILLGKSGKTTFRNSFFRVCRILGVFLFMCFLWTLWNSESVREYVFFMSFLSVISIPHLLLVVAGLIAALIVSAIIDQYLTNKPIVLTLKYQLIILIFTLSISFGMGWLGQEQNHNESGLQKFAKDIVEMRLNKRDLEVLERGYYEKMLNTNRNDGQAWETRIRRKREFGNDSRISSRTNDLMMRRLNPNVTAEWRGTKYSTNQWAMRDKEYSLEKPEGYFRFILLGSSNELGSGINDGENFETITELELNKISNELGVQGVEILNMSMGGYHLIQTVKFAHSDIWKFNPDAIIYAAHTDELYRCLGMFSRLIQNGVDLEFPVLKRIHNVSGAKQYMSRSEIRNKLKPFEKDIYEWGIKELALKCKENGAAPVYLFLPALADVYDEKEKSYLFSVAQLNNFIILDLTGVYNDYEIETLRVSESDYHPNSLGHSIISKLLLKRLIENKQIFKTEKSD